jgi:antitoxin component of RelBE/YafQ-DinJ toxin-antitoxin module
MFQMTFDIYSYGFCHDNKVKVLFTQMAQPGIIPIEQSAAHDNRHV